uniref:Uncharacterized protein n=1 Tax=viral metagenome TaxID=1070528 RepID=A0A6C0D0J0_9ZZZZ
MSNNTNIIVYVILLIILLAIIKVITIKYNYSPIFEWWNSNGGQNYDNICNIFSIMASNDSVILYMLSKLSGNLTTYSMELAQIQFLISSIFPLIKDSQNDDIFRFVLPRHVCKDITFKKEDGDYYFNNWLLDNPKYTTDIKLTYDSTCNRVYNTDGNCGVYPNYTDINGWKCLFREWGIKDWDNDSSNPSEAVIEEWLNVEKHPDNFLARYGIKPDSPLIISFIKGEYNEDSLKLDRQAFLNLIGGTSGNVGGWIGYMLFMKNSNISADEYNNYLFSKLNTGSITRPSNPAKICSGTQTASAALSGITSGAGIAGIAAFLPFPANLIAGLVGIGTGIATGINDANKCKE